MFVILTQMFIAEDRVMLWSKMHLHKIVLQ